MLTFRRILTTLLILVLLLLLGVVSANTDTRPLVRTATWDGGGADNLWSTAANWDGPDILPVAGDSVVFDATSVKAATVDIVTPVFNSLSTNVGYGATITLGVPQTQSWGTVSINGGTVLSAGANPIVTGSFTLGTTGTNALTFTSGSLTASGDFTVSAAADYVSWGSGTHAIAGAYADASTSASWNRGTGLVGFTSVTDQTMSFGDATNYVGASEFNRVYFDPSFLVVTAGHPVFTMSGGNRLTAGGVNSEIFIGNDGTGYNVADVLTLDDSAGLGITVAGQLTVDDNGVLILGTGTYSTGKIRENGALFVNAATLNDAGDFTVAGTGVHNYVQWGSSTTITVGGLYSVSSTSPSWSAGTGTVTMTGGGAFVPNQVVPEFHNLVFHRDGSIFTLGGNLHLTGILTVGDSAVGSTVFDLGVGHTISAANVTIQNNDAITAHDASITVTNGWYSAGVYFYGTATVTMTAPGGTIIDHLGDFYHLRITGGTWDSLDLLGVPIGGDYVQTGGILDLGTTDWDNYGSLTMTGNSVIRSHPSSSLPPNDISYVKAGTTISSGSTMILGEKWLFTGGLTVQTGGTVSVASTGSVEFDTLTVDGVLQIDGHGVAGVSMATSSGTIKLTTWSTFNLPSGASWTFDPTDAAATVTTTFDGMSPGAQYNLLRDGSVIDTQVANSGGTVTFSTVGGWSTHTMSISKVSGGGGGPPPSANETILVNQVGGYVYSFSLKLDGEAASVLWNFGDGSSLETTGGAIHSYSNSGVYTVTASVTKTDGSRIVLTKTITVPSSPLLQWIILFLTVFLFVGIFVVKDESIRVALAFLTLVVLVVQFSPALIKTTVSLTIMGTTTAGYLILGLAALGFLVSFLPTSNTARARGVWFVFGVVALAVWYFFK